MSYGGRMVLIKSILNSLPLYYFSLFRAPPCVLKILESVRRNFFWGGDGSNKKISWVGWNKTVLPYRDGGLNFGSLECKNLALLGKWWWRFKTETDCLWTKIIKSIYGIDGGLRADNGLAHLPSAGIWSNIILAGNHIEELHIPFKNSFQKSLGDGSTTSFWEETWCGSARFCDMFQRLFRLESNPSVHVNERIKTVAAGQIVTDQQGVAGPIDAGQFAAGQRAAAGQFGAGQRSAAGQNGSGNAAAADLFGLGHPAGAGQNYLVQFAAAGQGANANQNQNQSMPAGHLQFEWSWVRNPTGRTHDELVELSNLLSMISFDFTRPTSWNWNLANNGIFSVKKLSNIITSAMFPSQSGVVQKTLKNNLVPTKLEVFTWRVMKKRLPVRVELDKRGIDLHSVRCPVCDDDIESVDHAVIGCKLSREVWLRIYNWWGIGNGINRGFNDILHGLIPFTSSSLGIQIWQAVEWVSAYLLWKNRNAKVFKNQSSCASVIFNDIQVMSFDWVSRKLKKNSIDWLSWLSNPSVYCNI
ncbi:uncharacterized protein [Rutidosis leptorrhynchoides]|uniref:uncharacterized protein n=1 Tax=Rutidosis leptorrhynchoides TaxID=125765 RepID=UPI003A99C5E1